ncbi:MAG: response regulator [Fibrobacterales bacterium]
MAKILLVEDVKINSEMLQRRLTRQGFDVVPAFNGREAIDLAISEKPDLILMDLGLPEIDGYEATKTIREHDEVGKTPIVALTAYAQESDRQKAMNAGCDDFETKPIVIKSLLEKIEKQLNRIE